MIRQPNCNKKRIKFKSGAGGFRTLLVTCLFPDSYKLKNPKVKHRSNIFIVSSTNTFINL